MGLARLTFFQLSSTICPRSGRILERLVLVESAKMRLPERKSLDGPMGELYHRIARNDIKALVLSFLLILVI
jgi:hypothetical protein